MEYRKGIFDICPLLNWLFFLNYPATHLFLNFVYCKFPSNSNVQTQLWIHYLLYSSYLGFLVSVFYFPLLSTYHI